jgi:hypothetical protein
LIGTNLLKANLSLANLHNANISEVNLTEANLSGARLDNATISGANFSGAILRQASLIQARLVNVNLTEVDLSECAIYGLSVSGLDLRGANQVDLIISNETGPTIAVDNFEFAQFISLFLQNKNIRHIIDAISSKVVLILGHFGAERQATLATLRAKLRQDDYIPVSLDFWASEGQSCADTIATLALLARLIVVDLTNASTLAEALQKILPTVSSVPIQILLAATTESQAELAAVATLKGLPGVLAEFRYNTLEELALFLAEKPVISVEVAAQE